MHSPEVELTKIFVLNIFNGNGLAPSDMPPDTKNTTRGVHDFRFLGLYLGATKTGLPRAFRNGMTIGITPKNEVLRIKSLKQPILQEIKESSKFRNYGPP